MAFLPERNYIEETLVSGYTLSLGPDTFQSSDISRYSIVSFQVNTNSITGVNRFKLEQSANGTNWVPLKDVFYELETGAGSLVIEKSAFSGKYVRFNITDTDTGTISVLLICKR
jgi:hypothetical protein